MLSLLYHPPLHVLPPLSSFALPSPSPLSQPNSPRLAALPLRRWRENAFANPYSRVFVLLCQLQMNRLFFSERSLMPENSRAEAAGLVDTVPKPGMEVKLHIGTLKGTQRNQEA
ncbi:hypothetical protein Droror1_Dr00016239 [Drosera rotundifolia]